MLQFIHCKKCGVLKLVGIDGRRIYPEGGGGTLKEPLKTRIKCSNCGTWCKIENSTEAVK